MFLLLSSHCPFNGQLEVRQKINGYTLTFWPPGEPVVTEVYATFQAAKDRYEEILDKEFL